MLGNDLNTIGIFLSVPQGYFQSQVSMTVSRIGAELGYNTVFYCNYGTHDETNIDFEIGERSIVELPDYNKLAGVILLTDCFETPGMLEAMLETINKHPSLPVVSLRQDLPGYHSILMDDIRSMDVIMDHILGHHGHKKVYFLSGPRERADAQRRLCSYRNKMEEYGCEYNEDWIYYGNFWTTIGPYAADWIEKTGMPEVVVCANDYMAIALIEELARRGYKVPEDVKITGFDDIDSAAVATTSLTTVGVPFVEMADKAIHLIDDILRGDNPPMHTYVTTDLIVRESCGCNSKTVEDYIKLQHELYSENEEIKLNNASHIMFSRSAQNKHDTESVFATAFYFSAMAGKYRRMFFCMNESGDMKRYPVQSVLEYKSVNGGGVEHPDIIFDTDELVPLEPNNKPQSMFALPLHHESKIFGYVAIEMQDYLPVQEFFANYLVTITNSLEKIYQEKQVRKVMKMEKMARKQAEKANHIKDDFLVNLSHEIRTPLNAIVGLTNMLRDEKLSSTGMSYLTTIKYSSDNLLRMISDILDYSQMNAGELKITRDEYKTIDLQREIKQIIEMYCINREDLQYECILDDNTPVKLYGDKERIEQIMVNLCSNATKFTEKGKISALISWENNTDPDGTVHEDGWLNLTVNDTGIGIKKEHLKSIFGAFTQVDAARSRSRDGAGMGLAVCNMLASTMGGNIRVESVFGKGSSFHVRIPQEVSERIGINADDKKQNRSKGSIGLSAPGACVLVVDDNLMNLKVESLLLKKYQIKVITAMSGMKAIDILEKNPNIDLVFMDYMMPELDGAETTRIIISKGINVPIIAVTANTVSGATDIYYGAGMKDYLPKPIEMNKLEEILSRWLPEDKQVII